MNNNIMDKKIILGIIAILLGLASFIGVLAFKKENAKTILTDDQVKFKETYEALNGLIREKDGKKIKTISIKDNNPVDILTEDEVIDVLENKTGIIYFGFEDCPWCRTMLPVLLNSLENAGIENLYYLNIKDIRSTLSLDSKNKVQVDKEGTSGYYKILELLDEYLTTYTLTTSKGKEVKTGEKRLYAPTVVFVKNGKVVGIHEGTVESQTDSYEELTQEQSEELSNIYLNLIEKVYDINCHEAC